MSAIAHGHVPPPAGAPGTHGASGRRPPPPRSRRAAFGVLAAALAIVLTLGALEVAARALTRPQPPSDTAFGSPVRGLYRPRHQLLGVDLGKERSEFRIVVVGDSLSWGWRVHAEDAWPARLEWRLRPLLHPAVPLRVVNAARPGWNTEQQSAQFLAHIDALAPDAVLLGYCLNDAEPSDRDERERLNAARSFREPGRALSIRLHRASALYRTIRDRLENARVRRASERAYREMYREDSASYQAALAALLSLRSELERRAVPLLVVVIPSFDDPFGAANPKRSYHQQIERVCAERGLDCLDLLPLFDGHDVGRLASEPGVDPHPNEVAHRMIADALVAPLLERGMLPVDRDVNGDVVRHGCRTDESPLPRLTRPRARPRSRSSLPAARRRRPREQP